MIACIWTILTASAGSKVAISAAFLQFLVGALRVILFVHCI